MRTGLRPPAFKGYDLLCGKRTTRVAGAESSKPRRSVPGLRGLSPGHPTRKGWSSLAFLRILGRTVGDARATDRGSHWRRPGWVDRRLPVEQEQRSGDGPGGGSDLRRRHLADRAVQGLPLRHWRAPLFLQVEGSGRSVERIAARRHAPAAALLAHFLPQ